MHSELHNCVKKICSLNYTLSDVDKQEKLHLFRVCFPVILMHKFSLKMTFSDALLFHIGLIPCVLISMSPVQISKHTDAQTHARTHQHTRFCVLDCRLHGCLLGSQVTVHQTLWKLLSHTHLLLCTAPEEVSSCRFSAGQTWRWRQLVI